MPHIDFTSNARNFNPLASVTLHAETEPDNASFADCQVSLNPVNGIRTANCHTAGPGVWWNKLQPTILNNVFENAADDWYPISVPSFSIAYPYDNYYYEGMPGLGTTALNPPLENGYVMGHSNVTIWGINPSDFVIPNFVNATGGVGPIITHGEGFLVFNQLVNREPATTGRTNLFDWVHDSGNLKPALCSGFFHLAHDLWFDAAGPGDTQFNASNTVIASTQLSPDPRVISPLTGEMYIWQTPILQHPLVPLKIDMTWEWSFGLGPTFNTRRMTVGAGQFLFPDGNEPRVEYGWLTKSPSLPDGTPLPTDPNWNNTSTLITMRNTVPFEYFRPLWKHSWTVIYPRDKTSSYFKLTHDPSRSFGPHPGFSDTLEIDFGL